MKSTQGFFRLHKIINLSTCWIILPYNGIFDHHMKSLVHYLSNVLCHARLMLHNNRTKATWKKLDRVATLVTDLHHANWISVKNPTICHHYLVNSFPSWVRNTVHHSRSQSKKLGIDLVISHSHYQMMRIEFLFPVPLAKVRNRLCNFPFPIQNQRKVTRLTSGGEGGEGLRQFWQFQYWSWFLSVMASLRHPSGLP